MGKSNGKTYHPKSKKKDEDKQPPYFKVSHTVTSDPKFLKLKMSEQLLYFHLCRLRNRLTNGKHHTPERWFWRKNEMLMEDTGLSHGALFKARKGLLEKNYIMKKVVDMKPYYMITDDVYKLEQEKICEPDPPPKPADILVTKAELDSIVAPSEIPF